GRERMVAQLMGPESVFGDLDEAQRSALFAQCLPATIPDGTHLVREGHPGTAMCIIASGHADVWQRAPGGRRKTLITLGPGDVFGEIALLDGRVASANVEAVSPLTLFALDAEGFASAMDAFPEARDRIRSLVTRRLGGQPGESEPLPVVRVTRG
ncbi:MAG: cyclic nucleotide-binding domain-containing protein, partial [Myxococcales bacterium]|nr:cyclic nucleotide-binding domain-containing protein [Myxococcales bacterium]